MMSQLRRLAGPLRLLALGWYVALCLTAGILGGLWLDRTLGLLPLFTLLGLLLGLVVAFVGLYRMVSETVEADAEYRAEDDAAIAAARAARAATGEPAADTDREDENAADEDEPAGREIADRMSPRQLEAHRRAQSERLRSEDHREEQR